MVAGLLVVAIAVLITVGVAYHYVMRAAFAHLSRPSDELQQAVHSFHDRHERVPADMKELGAHAASNGLPLDAESYGTVTFARTNDYIRIDYRRKYASGHCYVLLDDDETGLPRSRGSLGGLVGHFHSANGRLPRSMQELREHIRKHELDFDIDAYERIAVRRKLFGRVRIEYETKPVGPRSSSGYSECDISSLTTMPVQVREPAVDDEPQSAEGDE